MLIGSRIVLHDISTKLIVTLLMEDQDPHITTFARRLGCHLHARAGLV
jgi:hypothetical protein